MATDEDKDKDPHGLKALMAEVGLKQADIVRMLNVAPNTVSRAMSTDETSDTRPLIEALLRRRQADLAGGPRPAPGVIENMVQGGRMLETRMVFSDSGKSRKIEVLVVDPSLSGEELEEEVRRWRKEPHG